MRPITSNQVTSAIFALVLALPVAAWSQTTTAPVGAPAVAPATTAAPIEKMADASADTKMSRQAKVEQRIADMHATLGITAPQEAQWDKFAQVMLDNAQAIDTAEGKTADKAESRNAEQALKAYATIAELHARNVEKLASAFDTLYGTLTPAQKTAADDMFRVKAEEHAAKQGG